MALKCIRIASAGALNLALALGSAVGGAAGARAEDAQTSVAVELNRLEAQGEACRAYMLLDNSRGAAWRALKLDLFVLDGAGVVAKRLGLETAPLGARKTSIRVFDLAGLSCSSIGRILLNDVLTCETAAGPQADCLDRIETRSKVSAVGFTK